MMLDVVVPSQAGPRDLGWRFQSLMEACHRAHVPTNQVVVVDDRSDATPDEPPQGGPVIVRTGGRGSGAARNAGADVGSSPWILFVDDDVELDGHAVAAAMDLTALIRHPIVAAIGSLRPPPSSPAWLVRGYQDTTMFPGSALSPPGPVTALDMSVTTLLMSRAAFDCVGRFPEIPQWGWVDALFGLRVLRSFGSEARLLRAPGLSGIHWYQPTWEEWVERHLRAGARLKEVVRELSEEEESLLLTATTLRGSWRSVVKRSLGFGPRVLWRYARGPVIRKAAAAGTFARGFRQGANAR